MLNIFQKVEPAMLINMYSIPGAAYKKNQNDDNNNNLCLLFILNFLNLIRMLVQF